ncbi:HAD-IA family hydrolase [Brachybacterium sacelli]|uniref:HAD superfamily hydrolase (TIGR01509 family) n=1 Tax=Brachybacterium sacelli TaxID=173364 RepID=A0ABS4X2U6_9MICO|nr:HAD-IA family hydrolase [Brachybacterium sacelli]MBP2382783.1 HAD superfamily hydrolase (TIGR01509 family) [Brachybacterium sacelli]
MRALIWDLGGTLVDTYPDVDRALASRIDPQPGQELLHEVAVLTRRSSSEAITTLAMRHGLAEETLRAAYESTKRRWRTRPAPVMAGARELLAAVRDAGGINLVSTHRDRASATALLEDLGLTLDDIVCAPDGYPRKPDPTMIRALLSRHELDPGECLAVGDRPADVEAAHAAGVRGVLLETPGIPLQAGEAERITSLTELLGRVRG